MPTKTFQGVTYTNGNAPTSILAPLDGDNWGAEPAYLRKDAAAAYNRARAEVLAKTGIVLSVRGWNRTLAEQEQFFHERYVKGLASADQRYHVHAGVGAWYGLRAGHAAAAIPGDSNHGWAIAIDVDDFGTVGNFNHPRRVAAIAILKRHGWTDDEGRSRIQEPWHLVYDPARDQHRGEPAPTPKGFLMALSDEKQEALSENARKTEVIVRRSEVRQKDMVRDLRSLTATVNAQASVIETLAKNAGLDPKAVNKTISDGVAQAMKNFELTLTPKES